MKKKNPKDPNQIEKGTLVLCNGTNYRPQEATAHSGMKKKKSLSEETDHNSKHHKKLRRKTSKELFFEIKKILFICKRNRATFFFK